MSRIGKLPIPVPKNVKVNIQPGVIYIEGPKGKLSQTYKPAVNFVLQNDQLIVTRKDDTRESKCLHGLYRNLAANMIKGVSEGYKRNLTLVGVGYRAELKGKSVLFSLGYSTQIEYVIPEGIQIAIDQNTKITVSGINKELVGRVASEIRSLRPPEPYKGKGVKYDEETIRRKVGKSTAKK